MYDSCVADLRTYGILHKWTMQVEITEEFFGGHSMSPRDCNATQNRRLGVHFRCIEEPQHGLKANTFPSIEYE